MFRRHHRETITLRRNLNLVDATIAGVGIIVGAGIYVLIGAAAGLAGNGLWISFIFAAIAAFLTGLSYAELSSIHSDDSGEYSYVEHNFGKPLAFIIGYLVIFSSILGAATVALGFGHYLSSILGVNLFFEISVLAIIIFTVINLVGIKQSMELNFVFTALSIIGLLIIIFMSIPYFGKVNYFETPNIPGIFKATSLIFFAYIGFEAVIKLAEETKNPRKTIPIALLLALSISTIIYILVAIASISILDWRVLASSNSPLSDVANAVMGSKAGILIGALAVVSTGNTILMILVSMSRMVYGVATKYAKLNFLTKIHKISNTPYNAIIFTSLISTLFLMFKNIEIVAEITNFFIFLVFAIVNLSLIKSRYSKHKHELFHSPFNWGKFPVCAFLGLLIMLFLIINLGPKVWGIGIIITLMGFVLYNFIK